MQETGVRRYVGVSAPPVGPIPPDDSFLNRRLIHPFFGWLLKETYADLALMEDELAQSGVEWTVVRPPKLVSKPVTGIYRTALDANIPRGLSVSREDTAHLMVAALDDPAMVSVAVLEQSLRRFDAQVYTQVRQVELVRLDNLATVLLIPATITAVVLFVRKRSL